ncbi:MAG: flagellar basal body-associated FliL family protein [Rhodobacteraceae bacterium]|jgi:flagellar FliL protein|nr:flagellar basal body-associated FliL family protein [Paracoccaceae bacterium]
MAKTENGETPSPAKKSRLPFVIGLILAIAGGGGGFYAVYTGLILGEPADFEVESKEDAPQVKAMPDVRFVPVEPLVINVDEATGTHLRFRAQLEVRTPYQAEVENLLPRVVDVLNSYLRAVDVADLRDNTALVRLRAQMLRRIQIVTGRDRVNDLLIMEFVLN